MNIVLAHVGPRFPTAHPLEAPTQDYLRRIGHMAQAEAAALRSEADLFQWIGRRQDGGRRQVVFLDSRGRQMTSEAFAQWVGTRRDSGIQHFLFVVGPADGWSDSARERADFLLSLGAFTMPHALARLVMAEQLYRACTILAGHPYHTGH